MDHRLKAILIGVGAGALLGAAVAWTASQGYEDAREGEDPIKALSPVDYFSLAIGILTLARQLGSMLKRV
jgi:hypothetical protein